MKVQTDFGEKELEEVIRCYNLWRKMITKSVQRRNETQKTEEGKEKNRENSKSYYQKNREQILAKRKEQYAAKKEKPQFID